VLPALLVLLVRLWVPESPRWLCRQGRYEDARQSLAWALQMEPSALPLPTAADAGPVIKSNWLDLFKYPRSMIVSWLGNAGAQTGVYGITLWAPSLFVLLLKVTPQEASKMMILLSVGFICRHGQHSSPEAEQACPRSRRHPFREERERGGDEATREQDHHLGSFLRRDFKSSTNSDGAHSVMP